MRLRRRDVVWWQLNSPPPDREKKRRRHRMTADYWKREKLLKAPPSDHTPTEAPKRAKCWEEEGGNIWLTRSHVIAATFCTKNHVTYAARQLLLFLNFGHFCRRLLWQFSTLWKDYYFDDDDFAEEEAAAAAKYTIYTQLMPRGIRRRRGRLLLKN